MTGDVGTGSDQERRQLALRLAAIAREAGEAILEIYDAPGAVREKADHSPVTAADEAAERLILARLEALSPKYPIVAEESVAAGRIPKVGHGPFWLVDPLDGTLEFVHRMGEFTVNIGLIEDGRPTLGVVYLPAQGKAYLGCGPGKAWRIVGSGAPQPIVARPAPAEGLIAVASRSHRDAKTEAFLAEKNIESWMPAGSALKFCLIAEGAADVYPRFGRTMEWDTAAGHAVLAAAGGRVHDLDGRELRYGKPDFANPAFIAEGRPGV